MPAAAPHPAPARPAGRITRGLRKIVEKIGQIGLFHRQRQPPAQRGAQVAKILARAQQLIARPAEHRQIPLQDRILHVRQKRENGPGSGQKRRQRGGDGLCGAGKRTGAGVVVADGQKQQQGPLQRLHLRGHVAAAQPQRQHRGRGGDQLLQHRVGRQKLPDRAAGRDEPLGTAAGLRDHAVLHEQDRLGRAVKECMKLFG